MRPVRTVIQAPRRWPGLGLEELWRFRAIAVVLAKRALMVRYRKTGIGVAWVLIQPLTMMAVFAFFFGFVISRHDGELPFAVHVFTGLVVWMMVARILGQGATSVNSNAGLLTKIYFPRAYLPISVAISSIVDFAFGILALLVLLAIFGIVPTIWVMAVPWLALMAFAAALGIAFWLAALSAQYRDVEQLLPFLTQIWFFSVPIIYATSMFPPQVQPIFWINPVAVAVEGFRWAFTGLTSPPPVAAWLTGSAVAIVLLVSGYIFFRSREPIIADLA